MSFVEAQIHGLEGLHREPLGKMANALGNAVLLLMDSAVSPDDRFSDIRVYYFFIFRPYGQFGSNLFYLYLYLYYYIILFFV